MDDGKPIWLLRKIINPFETIVTPIILYGCEVWGCSILENLGGKSSKSIILKYIEIHPIRSSS